MSHQVSRLRENIFRLLAIVIPIIAFCLLGEIALRLRGWKPFNPSPPSVVVEPVGKLAGRHSELGYSLLPGAFKITLSDGYTWEATTSDDGLRVTHPLAASGFDALPEIWIFGDSFTYGWSLNDAETYPWLLQRTLNRYKVMNFGVPGYGTIHALIQLREALRHRKPVVAVVAYASFHDERNTLSREIRKLAVIYNKLGPSGQPYARLGPNQKLRYYFIDNDEISYSEFPLMRHSALITYVELRYNQLDAWLKHSHEVSKAIIKEFAEECRKNGVQLVVSGIESDGQTADMLEYCRNLGILTTDISVDMTKKENMNFPHDTHPGPAAARSYADRLALFLSSHILAKP